MATWEDGPEYAPALRPDHFAEPAGAAPAGRTAGPPPVRRLRSSAPPSTIRRLRWHRWRPWSHRSRTPATRRLPFDVVSATLTEATSAWSATHWSPPAGPPLLDGSLPLAAGTCRRPRRGRRSGPSVAHSPARSRRRARPQWFQPAPPPYAPTDTGPERTRRIAQALTLGVIICLAVGGIVWPLAPITLAHRLRPGQPRQSGTTGRSSASSRPPSRCWSSSAWSAALLSDGFFSDWWELVARWSQVLCWLTLVAGWIAVWRGLPQLDAVRTCSDPLGLAGDNRSRPRRRLADPHRVAAAVRTGQCRHAAASCVPIWPDRLRTIWPS